MNKIIKFRPHHFLCTIAYQGMGYSKDFVTNYDFIAKQIKNNENIKIEVTNVLDSICASCPHKIIKSNSCTEQDKIMKLDSAHAKILNLKNKQVISFYEAKEKIKQNMTLELFYEACKPCEWQSLGICEKALINLIKD